MKELLVILFIIFILSSCTNKNNETEDPIKDILEISESNSEKKLKKFYSNSTVSVVKKLEKKYPGSEILKGLDKILITKSLEYEIVNKQCSTNQCIVEIKVNNHENINYIGLVVVYKLIYEDSKWKIDRSDELRKYLK